MSLSSYFWILQGRGILGLAVSRLRSRVIAPAAHSSLLPFNFEPPSRSYLYSALPLGIIARKEALRGPALNYHLQLFFPTSKLQESGRKAHVRFLPGMASSQFAALGYYAAEARHHDQVMATRPGELIRECATHLAAGTYIRAIINEFFIPGSVRYRRAHHRHDILLLGYSRERNAFKYAAYQENGSLTPNEVPVAVFVEALNLRRYGVFKAAVPFALEMIRPARACPDAVDRTLIKAQLHEYLAGVHNVAKYDDGGVYSIPHGRGLVVSDPAGACGVSVYDCYERYFQLFAQHPHHIDLRVTRVLMEHKALVRMALAASVPGTGASPAIKGFDHVVALTHKLHLTAFAVFQGAKRANTESLVSLVREIRASEMQSLPEILKLWD